MSPSDWQQARGYYPADTYASVAAACGADSAGGADGDGSVDGDAAEGGDELAEAGVDAGGEHDAAGEPIEGIPAGVSVGAVALFAAEGLHQIPGSSLLIGRDAQGLYARSSLCTHSGCNMNTKGKLLANGGIHCNCHGSEFDLTGVVTRGPAAKALSAEAVAVGDDGNVYVDASTPVDPSFRVPG